MGLFEWCWTLVCKTVTASVCVVVAAIAFAMALHLLRWSWHHAAPLRNNKGGADDGT